MPDEFESIRVVDERTAQVICSISDNTWKRLRARGEAPPLTRISPRRIGYRISDLRKWLDERREGAAGTIHTTDAV